MPFETKNEIKTYISQRSTEDQEFLPELIVSIRAVMDNEDSFRDQFYFLNEQFTQQEKIPGHSPDMRAMIEEQINLFEENSPGIIQLGKMLSTYQQSQRNIDHNSMDMTMMAPEQPANKSPHPALSTTFTLEPAVPTIKSAALIKPEPRAPFMPIKTGDGTAPISSYFDKQVDQAIANHDRKLTERQEQHSTDTDLELAKRLQSIYDEEDAAIRSLRETQSTQDEEMAKALQAAAYPG